MMKFTYAKFIMTLLVEPENIFLHQERIRITIIIETFKKYLTLVFLKLGHKYFW